MTLVKRKNNDWFPAMFNDIFANDWLGGTTEMNKIGFDVPAVNIVEHETSFEISLAAPGKTKADFKIELNDDVLTISAEEKTENEARESGKFTRKEFSYASFKRSFTLPETVENAKISAQYDNGILRIAVPKKEEAKAAPKRMIEIA